MSPDRPGTRTNQLRRGGPPGGSSDSHSPLVFSRAASGVLDRAATSELGIPSLLLMEHASLGLARHARELSSRRGGSPAGVLIVCGTGNNAGDGFALARHLHIEGDDVRLVLARGIETYAGDAAVNISIARRMGIEVEVVAESEAEAAVVDAAEALGERGGLSLVVDALLGTGLKGVPRSPIDAMIRAVNRVGARGAPVLAVDIPSGLDADTGMPVEAGGAAVRATRTVTFEGLKRGFLSIDAQAYVGEVWVESIGVPRTFAARFADTPAAAARFGVDAREKRGPGSGRAVFGDREGGKGRRGDERGG